MVKVFRQKQSAVIVSGNRQNECVPHGQLVVNGQIQRRLESKPCRVGHLKCVSPTQDGLPNLRSRALGFCGQNAAKLTQNLRWQQHVATRHLFHQFKGGTAAQLISKPFGIGKDVGVKGNFHGSGTIQFIARPLPNLTGLLLLQPRQQIQPGRLLGRAP
jgi:hypothetical protein